MRQLNFYLLAFWFAAGNLCISLSAIGEDDSVPKHEATSSDSASTKPGNTVVNQPAVKTESSVKEARVAKLREALETSLAGASPESRSQVLSQIVEASGPGKTVPEAKAIIENIPKELLSDEARKLLVSAIEKPVDGGSPISIDELVGAARAAQLDSKPPQIERAEKQPAGSVGRGAANLGKAASGNPESEKSAEQQNALDPKQQALKDLEDRLRESENRLREKEQERDLFQTLADQIRQKQAQDQQNRERNQQNQANNQPSPQDFQQPQPQPQQDSVGRGVENALKHLGKQKDQQDLSKLFDGIDDDKSASRKEEKPKPEPLFNFDKKDDEEETEPEEKAETKPATDDEVAEAGPKGPPPEGPFEVPGRAPVPPSDVELAAASLGDAMAGAAGGGFDAPIKGGAPQAAAGDGGNDPMFASVGQEEMQSPPIKYTYKKGGDEMYGTGSENNATSVVEQEVDGGAQEDGDAPSTKPKLVKPFAQILYGYSGHAANGKKGIFAWIGPCEKANQKNLGVCRRGTPKKHIYSNNKGFNELPG